MPLDQPLKTRRTTTFLDSLKGCISSCYILLHAITDLSSLHNTLENLDSNENRRHKSSAEKSKSRKVRGRERYNRCSYSLTLEKRLFGLSMKVMVHCQRLQGDTLNSDLDTNTILLVTQPCYITSEGLSSSLFRYLIS